MWGSCIEPVSRQTLTQLTAPEPTYRYAIDTDKRWLVGFFRTGEKMKFPGPISIPELPVIDWSKYTSGTAESFQRRLGGGTRRKTQRQESEESGGSGEGGGGGDGRTSQLFVRGRVYSESKPQVRQSYFISEKSPLILEINLLTFSSHRYRTITAMKK